MPTFLPMPGTWTPHAARTRPSSPHGLLASAFGWYVVGSAALISGLGFVPSPDTRTGIVGSTVVTSAVSSAPQSLWVVAAVAVWVLGALLAVGGQGWSAYPLAVLGAGLTVALAMTGSFAAIAVMIGLVLGTAPLATPSVYGFVTGRADA